MKVRLSQWVQRDQSIKKRFDYGDRTSQISQNIDVVIHRSETKQRQEKRGCWPRDKKTEMFHYANQFSG